MIFSIAMGAEYLSYVKSIANFALTFFGCIILVLASVANRNIDVVEIFLKSPNVPQEP